MDNGNIAKFSVLVVDDDPSFRTILKSIYTQANYTVNTAEDGEAASRLLEANPVDLVITDIQMPHINGIELAQIIHDRFPKTNVILMGSDLTDERYADYIAEYQCPCLTKPFRRDDVLQLSNRILNSRSTMTN